MFFLRCYRKGAAQSGTLNIAEWDKCPDLNNFYQTCEGNGIGKYILFQRGKGIRGFRKITDCIVAEPAELQVFAAETISVRKNLNIGDMTTPELMELLGSMSRTSLSSPEEMTQFQKDPAPGGLFLCASLRGIIKFQILPHPADFFLCVSLRKMCTCTTVLRRFPQICFY